MSTIHRGQGRRSHTVDYDPETGREYYRVQMIDRDGGGSALAVVVCFTWRADAADLPADTRGVVWWASAEYDVIADDVLHPRAVVWDGARGRFCVDGVPVAGQNELGKAVNLALTPSPRATTAGPTASA
jgi:hypothetical protein